MKRPAFLFYPADWRNNAKLRRCSHAARGAWIDVMCVLHDSDTYGMVDWPLRDLAKASEAPISLMRELVSKGVLKGCDSGQCESLIYVPRSGRKAGPPVTLISPKDGPLWYSSRMVEDEYIRSVRSDNSDTPKPLPKPLPEHALKPSPKVPIGEAIDEHPSRAQAPRADPSSSSSIPSGTSYPSGFIDATASHPTDAAEASPDGAPSGGADASEPKRNGHAVALPRGVPDCPQQTLVALYAERLPTLRQPASWDGARATAMRERWRECSQPTSFGDGYATEAEGVTFWAKFFDFVAECPKLVDGITTTQNGQTRTWKPTLDWLVTKGNFLKVIEGNYTS